MPAPQKGMTESFTKALAKEQLVPTTGIPAGPNVRTAPSNQAGQLKVESMRLYQTAAANAKARQSPGDSSELKADL